MTVMQQRAIDMISRIPDNKMFYVMEFLEKLAHSPDKQASTTLSAGQAAYNNLQRFRRCSDTEPDYEADLADALEQKYASSC